MHTNTLAGRLGRVDHYLATTDAHRSIGDGGSVYSLARLRRGVDDADDVAAMCGSAADANESASGIAAGTSRALNHRHAFRGPFPHTSHLEADAAATGAALDSTLREIAPALQDWLCSVRKHIGLATTKKIYIIGYAQDNPILGFAIGEKAAEFLIKSGVDPRLLSVSKDDQARTGRDVWLRVIEIPTRAGAELRRRPSRVTEISKGQAHYA